MNDLKSRRVRPGFWVALMLAWFWGQVITVSPEMGITADEIIHQASGYEYWRRGDYRVQPENGNLPQRLVALPLLWLKPTTPPLDDRSMMTADIWGFSHRTYFHLGNQPELMIFLGRLLVAAVGVLTGWLVFLWARSLWGAGGGLIATAFFTTSPNLLAHAGLTTSDMMAAFGFLAAVLSGWRVLHRVTVGRVLAFGVAAAGLALAKFSAVLFAVMFAGLVVTRLARRTPLLVARGGRVHRVRGWARLPWLGGATVAALLMVWLGIWAAFSFRFAAAPGDGPGQLMVPWATLRAQVPMIMQTPVPDGIPAKYGVEVKPTAVRTIAGWALDHRLLPEAYVYGFLHVYTYSFWRPAFFLGAYDTQGWRTFFPVAVLLKTPLIHLGLGLLAGLTLLRLHRLRCAAGRHWYRLSPLLWLVGVYWVFAITSHLNIGIRHLLPADCALFVLAGTLALPLRRHRALGGIGLAVLFVAANVLTWRQRPGYLSYFNAIAGGPNRGYHYLVDSSLDWGQGLPRLKTWLDRNRGQETVYLAYFGAASPTYENLRALRIGDTYFRRDPGAYPVMLGPGIYVISATLFQGVYTMVPAAWTDAHERLYRRDFQKALGADRAKLPQEFWLEWDQLRFARLRLWLHGREPDAQPDPSLLVFRLDAQAVSEALGYDDSAGR